MPIFTGVSLTSRYVPTCSYLVCHGSKPVRLACLIHAASIHPELGSNSNLRQVLRVNSHVSAFQAYERSVLFSTLSWNKFLFKDKTKEYSTVMKLFYLIVLTYSCGKKMCYCCDACCLNMVFDHFLFNIRYIYDWDHRYRLFIIFKILCSPTGLSEQTKNGTYPFAYSFERSFGIRRTVRALYRYLKLMQAVIWHKTLSCPTYKYYM